VRIRPNVTTVDRLTIKKLIPNGTTVKKGDILVEFDKTSLEKEIEGLRLEVQTAENELISVKEDLKRQRLSNEIEISNKKMDLEMAQKELQRFKELEGKKLLKSAEIQLKRAEMRYNEAKRNLEEAKILFKEELIPESELKRAQLQEKESRYTLEVARLEYELATKYTYPLQLKKLKQRYKAAKKLLDSTIAYAKSLILQKESAVAKAQSKLLKLRGQLDKKLKDLENFIVRSPVNGIINYGDPSPIPWWRREQQEELEPGANVYKRRVLMYIPESKNYVVEMMVGETDIARLKKGLECTIKVDAYPDYTLHGYIQEISLVGERSWGTQEIRFKVRCDVKEIHDWFKPNLKAKVDIFVKELKNILYVPVDAIYQDGDKSYCFVIKGETYEKRFVTIGENNNEYVEIKNGLNKGEKVSLYEPG
jgi:multidrug resistance efflux pump